MLIEAGSQRVAVHEEHLLVLNSFLLDGQGEVNATVQHYLEQQFFRRGVGFDVMHEQVEVGFV